MNATQIVGGFGPVSVVTENEKGERHTVTLSLAPLTVGEELQLDAELKALVDAERSAKRDRQLAEVGSGTGTWAHKQFIQELVRHVMGGVDLFEVSEKRYDLAGIRVELWHRAKKTQPALRREEVDAVVTVANCLDVRKQIDAAINPQTESGQTPTKS